MTYKGHDLPPGVGIDDLELGQERELTYHEWITDSSIDNQGAGGTSKARALRPPRTSSTTSWTAWPRTVTCC